jgi:hypothetical protein
MRAVLGTALGLLVTLLALRPAAADTFQDFFGEAIEPIGTALGTSVARSFPLLSASPGVGYEFDVSSGAFVRRSAVFGQLFLERTEPLGRGHWNVSLSYQHVRLSSVDGQDLDDLQDLDPIRFGREAPFVIPRLAIELDTHQTTASVTYGLLDDLDVNLTVPVVYSEFALDAVLGAEPVRLRGSTLGIGDLALRGKCRILDGGSGSLAAALAVRVPTGSEGDFQGTGDTELTPLVVWSSPLATPEPWLEVQGFFNGGVNLDVADVDASEGRWGTGLDLRFFQRGSLALAFLARHAFHRLGDLDVPRADGTTAPLFGLDLERSDVYDLSLGGRVMLWRDTLMAFANVLVPLNDSGVRPSPIPLVGVEAAF